MSKQKTTQKTAQKTAQKTTKTQAVKQVSASASNVDSLQKLLNLVNEGKKLSPTQKKKLDKLAYKNHLRKLKESAEEKGIDTKKVLEKASKFSLKQQERAVLAMISVLHQKKLLNYRSFKQGEVARSMSVFIKGDVKQSILLHNFRHFLYNISSDRAQYMFGMLYYRTQNRITNKSGGWVMHEVKEVKSFMQEFIKNNKKINPLIKGFVSHYSIKKLS